MRNIGAIFDCDVHVEKGHVKNAKQSMYFHLQEIGDIAFAMRTIVK